MDGGVGGWSGQDLGLKGPKGPDLGLKLGERDKAAPQAPNVSVRRLRERDIQGIRCRPMHCQLISSLLALSANTEDPSYANSQNEMKIDSKSAPASTTISFHEID